MHRNRVLVVVLVAIAIVAASCSKNDSAGSGASEQAAQAAGRTTAIDVLEALKRSLNDDGLTTFVQNVFPNAKIPAETSDATRQLLGALADLAETQPAKTGCAAVSILWAIVKGVKDGASKLSGDSPIMVLESLKPLEDGLAQLSKQPEYVKDCAGSGNDSLLTNQAGLVTALLQPIVDDWNPKTLVCDILEKLDGIIALTGWILYFSNMLLISTIVLIPLTLSLFVFDRRVVEPAYEAVEDIGASLGCAYGTNKSQPSVQPFNKDEVLRLARSAQSSQ